MSELKRIPITVFTGAGASRAEPISLPTMFEFFQQIMDDQRYPKSPRITDEEYFKFVFNTLYGKERNYDLERVMGALYNMSNFMEDDSWRIFNHPDLYHNIYTNLNRSLSMHGTHKDSIAEIAKTTYLSRKEKAHQLVRQLEDLIRGIYEPIDNKSIRIVYEPFFQLLIDKNKSDAQAPIIPYFTTNYDMSIDWFFKPQTANDRPHQSRWARKNKITLVDGFMDQEWFAENFDEIDEINSKGDLFFPYHKLHGSLYWEKKSGIVRWNWNSARDMHADQELMIVYPSDKKILSENPYFYSHKMLDSYLARTDKLFVIGFSFRDPALVQAFQYALSYNNELKVYIVTPDDPIDVPEIQEFIEKNTDRAEHIKQYFGTKECLAEIESKLK